MATNPTLITTPFAQSGDKTTPPNTNTPSDGRFSQTLGFPPVTAIPLGSGGKAPKREDFNGAFNMLSNIAFYAQKGWVFQWDSGQTYYAGCIVRYSGNLYACTSDVTSTTNPASDTSHWSQYKILPGVDYATKSDAGGGGYNARDEKTSSGTYSAPVSGWYKITVKGGGGGGGGGNTSHRGGGGGEGGTTIVYAKFTAGNSISYVVGAGGSGGSANSAGSNGGSSSVTISGTTYTGGGGYGGAGVSDYQALNSNYGKGGSCTIVGCPGGAPTATAHTGNGLAGGGSGGGVGFASSLQSSQSGTSGTGGGGAGGGSQSGSPTGGSGGSGYVWFEYFDASLN